MEATSPSYDRRPPAFENRSFAFLDFFFLPFFPLVAFFALFGAAVDFRESASDGNDEVAAAEFRCNGGELNEPPAALLTWAVEWAYAWGKAAVAPRGDRAAPGVFVATW